MRNYATKFSAGFAEFPSLPGTARKELTELFLRSFDGSLSPSQREAASGTFLTVLRAQRGAKGVREEIEGWYGRIGEWFRSTVPSTPPGNEQVAEAVLFAVKDGRFLENPFLAITTLPPFSSFPPVQAARKALSASEPGLVVSTGSTGPLHRRLHEALSQRGIRVTSVSDAETPPGQARVTRPSPGAGTSGRSKPQETQMRAMDLSDPNVVEPWLDNSLVGGTPPLFGVLLVGLTAGNRGVLDFSLDEKRRHVAHVQKAVALVSECARAVRDGGHLVVVGPPRGTGEGMLLLAALRQTVRTFLAEQHFLPSAKMLRVSLLVAPSPGAERELERDVLGILSGTDAPRVEPVPVGHLRP